MIELWFWIVLTVAGVMAARKSSISLTDYSINRMGLFSFFRKNKQESRFRDSDVPKSCRGGLRTPFQARQAQARQGSAASRRPGAARKKRARRRLVGAVALVLAAVVGLPMLLDSEPKPLADDIAIRFPRRTSARREARSALRRRSPMSPRRHPASAWTRTRKSSTRQACRRPWSPGHRLQPAPKCRNWSSRNPGPAPTPRLNPRPESLRPAKVEPKSESKAERKTELAHVKPVEKVDEASRAKAILEGKPEPKVEARAEPKKESDASSCRSPRWRPRTRSMNCRTS